MGKKRPFGKKNLYKFKKRRIQLFPHLGILTSQRKMNRIVRTKMLLLVHYHPATLIISKSILDTRCYLVKEQQWLHTYKMVSEYQEEKLVLQVMKLFLTKIKDMS